jgi:hypothetical protein
MKEGEGREEKRCKALKKIRFENLILYTKDKHSFRYTNHKLRFHSVPNEKTNINIGIFIITYHVVISTYELNTNNEQSVKYITIERANTLSFYVKIHKRKLNTIITWKSS